MTEAVRASFASFNPPTREKSNLSVSPDFFFFSFLSPQSDDGPVVLAASATSSGEDAKPDKRRELGNY